MAAGNVDISSAKYSWALAILGVSDQSACTRKDLEKVRLKTVGLYKQYKKDKKDDQANKVIEAFEVLKKKHGIKSSSENKSSNERADKKPPDPAGKADASKPGSNVNGQKPAVDQKSDTNGKKTQASLESSPVSEHKRTRFLVTADAPAIAAVEKNSQGCLARPNSNLICSCGQSCTLPRVPKLAAGESFVCPACRVRSMDPFNVVLEGRKGMLKEVMLQPPLIPADAASKARFKFQVNLPGLLKWSRGSHNVEARMCCIDDCEAHQRWPERLVCKVNGQQAFEVLPPQPGHPRRDLPHRLSAYLRTGVNTIEVDTSDPNVHRFVLCLVRTGVCIPRKLCKQVSFLPVEDCKQRVSKLLWESMLDSTGEDVNATGSDRCSLTCPITLARIETPVRGLRCRHLQCFDLRAYTSSNVRMASMNKRWHCPVCNLVLKPPIDLFIDTHMLHVLSSTGADDEEICFTSNAEWTVTSSVPSPASLDSDMEAGTGEVDADEALLTSANVDTLPAVVGRGEPDAAHAAYDMRIASGELPQGSPEPLTSPLPDSEKNPAESPPASPPADEADKTEPTDAPQRSTGQTVEPAKPQEPQMHQSSGSAAQASAQTKAAVSVASTASAPASTTATSSSAASTAEPVAAPASTTVAVAAAAPRASIQKTAPKDEKQQKFLQLQEKLKELRKNLPQNRAPSKEAVAKSSKGPTATKALGSEDMAEDGYEVFDDGYGCYDEGDSAYDLLLDERAGMTNWDEDDGENERERKLERKTKRQRTRKSPSNDSSEADDHKPNGSRREAKSSGTRKRGRRGVEDKKKADSKKTNGAPKRKDKPKSRRRGKEPSTTSSNGS